MKNNTSRKFYWLRLKKTKNAATMQSLSHILDCHFGMLKRHWSACVCKWRTKNVNSKEMLSTTLDSMWTCRHKWMKCVHLLAHHGLNAMIQSLCCILASHFRMLKEHWSSCLCKWRTKHIDLKEALNTAVNHQWSFQQTKCVSSFVCNHFNVMIQCLCCGSECHFRMLERHQFTCLHRQTKNHWVVRNNDTTFDSMWQCQWMECVWSWFVIFLMWWFNLSLHFTHKPHMMSI